MKATSKTAAYLMQILGVALIVVTVWAFLAVIFFILDAVTFPVLAASLLTAVFVNVLGIKIELIMEKKHREETILAQKDNPQP